MLRFNPGSCVCELFGLSHGNLSLYSLCGFKLQDNSYFRVSGLVLVAHFIRQNVMTRGAGSKFKK